MREDEEEALQNLGNDSVFVPDYKSASNSLRKKVMFAETPPRLHSFNSAEPTDRLEEEDCETPKAIIR